MAQVNLGQFIDSLTKGGNRELAAALQIIQDGLNNLGAHVGADPVGKAAPPPPIQGLDIKTSGEMVHATITDNNAINKGNHYFLEVDSDPSFSRPHVIHMGASRSPTTFTLPTKNDDNEDYNWHFRAYSQYPGSDPGPIVAYGGNSPTPVTLGGTTALTLVPSTGSGTAAADGKQGGSGFGKVNQRPSIQPKRYIPT